MQQTAYITVQHANRAIVSVVRDDQFLRVLTASVQAKCALRRNIHHIISFLVASYKVKRTTQGLWYCSCHTRLNHHPTAIVH